MESHTKQNQELRVMNSRYIASSDSSNSNPFVSSNRITLELLFESQTSL
jgi:hypothetical protein